MLLSFESMTSSPRNLGIWLHLKATHTRTLHIWFYLIFPLSYWPYSHEGCWERRNSTLHFPNGFLESKCQIHFLETPRLFFSIIVNKTNQIKIVFRKLPPGAFETKKRCCPSVGLSYRIFQIAAKKIYNHLTTMEVANRQTIRNVDSIFRG